MTDNSYFADDDAYEEAEMMQWLDKAEKYQTKRQQQKMAEYEQKVMQDEINRINEKLNPSPQLQAEIQRALAEDPSITEKAIRKSVRKRVETVVSEVQKRKGQAAGQPTPAQQMVPGQPQQPRQKRSEEEYKKMSSGDRLKAVTEDVLPPPGDPFWGF